MHTHKNETELSGRIRCSDSQTGLVHHPQALDAPGRLQRELLAVDTVVGRDELQQPSVHFLQLTYAQRSLRSTAGSAALPLQLSRSTGRLTWALKSKRSREAETWDPLCLTVGPRTCLRTKLRRWVPVCFTMQASLWTWWGAKAKSFV